MVASKHILEKNELCCLFMWILMTGLSISKSIVETKTENQLPHGTPPKNKKKQTKR